MPGQNADRTGHNAFESSLTPATVGELAQAWQSDPLFQLAASDPVVSSAGVHVVIGGCAAFTFDPADGEWLMLDSGVSPLCETGDTAFMQMIRGFSPPYVVDGRLLWSHWGAWDRNAPRPPDYQLFGGVAHYDLASEQLLSANGGPGMLLAAVRGDTAVATSYRVEWTAPQPPFPSIQIIVSDTVVGSISDPTARRTLQVPGAVGATLGPDTFYASGNGTLATTPGDTATGQAVRAYSVTESRPGCGATANQECPLWATAVDGTATRAVIGADLEGSTVFVGTSAGTVYALDAVTGAVRWTATVGAAVSASPALADGVLYVPTADGRLVALD
ncbi:MAG TPA: PQQ-binding-like beta-propeller repeat protein, partial [Acidimicrobiales bacterium]|nr:PQQ-binding-like beta-propeller repeat protein [Acidimicrobiales bacterium]